jgi:hypothetical protein
MKTKLTTYFIISVVILLLSSCVKRKRMMKDITGEYDVVKLYSYAYTSGEVFTDTVHCAGKIEKESYSQFVFTHDCGGGPVYYSIDKEGTLIMDKENDFDSELHTFDWEDGALTLITSHHDLAVSSHIYIYAVKTGN